MKKRNVVVLDKEDFTKYAIEGLGIWDALTEGLSTDVKAVDVLVLGKAS